MTVVLGRCRSKDKCSTHLLSGACSKEYTLHPQEVLVTYMVPSHDRHSALSLHDLVSCAFVQLADDVWRDLVELSCRPNQVVLPWKFTFENSVVVACFLCLRRCCWLQDAWRAVECSPAALQRTRVACFSCLAIRLSWYLTWSSPLRCAPTTKWVSTTASLAPRRVLLTVSYFVRTPLTQSVPPKS